MSWNNCSSLSYSRGGFTIPRPVGVEEARVSSLIQIQLAEIHNAELIQNIIKQAKIQIQTDKVPTQLAEKVVPVLVAATPERLIQFKANSASDATTANIHTTHSSKETYLMGIQMTIAKDAVSDSIISSVRATPFGSADLGLLAIRYEPTTASSALNESIFFPIAMKLEKATTITVTNSTATASIDTTATIFYYEVDTD